MNTSTVNKWALLVVGVVIFFSIVAQLIPELQTAGDSVSDSGRCEDAGGYWNETGSACQVADDNTTALTYTDIPLNGLFSSSGIVILIIIASIVLVVIRSFMKK